MSSTSPEAYEAQYEEPIVGDVVPNSCPGGTYEIYLLSLYEDDTTQKISERMNARN